MNDKELKIISHFRKNARENLTTASKKLRIPISTIYDRLKRYEGKIITKHTSLINFAELGYKLKIQMVIKVSPKWKKPLQSFLEQHSRINSLSAISNGFDFLVEVILKDLQEVAEFIQSLDPFHIIDRHEFYIIEDIRREEFLCNTQNTQIPLSHAVVVTNKNIYK